MPEGKDPQTQEKEEMIPNFTQLEWILIFLTVSNAVAFSCSIGAMVYASDVHRGLYALKMVLKIRDITMAIEGKYGKITTEKKQIPEDEPVFLLRATDHNTPAVLAGYMMLCCLSGCSIEHLNAIEEHKKRIQDWQEANPSKVKKPD